MNSLVVKVINENGKFIAIDAQGNDWTSEVGYGGRKRAFQQNKALERRVNKNGENYWWKVPMAEFLNQENNMVSEPITEESVSVEIPSEHEEVLNFIHSSYNLKPRGLMMKELKWKYLVRSAVRGKNIMMTGAAGCGKTMAAKALVNSLDRPDFYFNLGLHKPQELL